MICYIKNLPFIFLFLLLIGNKSIGQEQISSENVASEKLLDSLWQNPISFFNINDNNWRMLCENLGEIDLNRINKISQSIFDGMDAKILNQTDASEGTLGMLNKKAHKKKTKEFGKKIRNGFRNSEKYPNHKIVLMEGDSWFEYPVFLNDVTDNLMKNESLAIYSMASAGDWVSNMVSNHQYQIEYLKLKPDVFILSGGGNDILGDYRLASFINMNPIEASSPFLIDFSEYVVLRSNSKPVSMCSATFCPKEYHDYLDILPELKGKVDSLTLKQIVNGRRYINKGYYRWLVSLKLEYKILIESLRKLDEEHFKELIIITQGYDYSIPSFKEKFGKSMFTKNGKWIKEPLMMKGILDQQTQQDIIMALIFDFNEMIIELGKEFDNIYHIDSRGFTNYLERKDHKKKGRYWYDEIHPKSKVYKEISDAYIALIFNEFKNHHKVVNVIEYYELRENY